MLVSIAGLALVGVGNYLTDPTALGTAGGYALVVGSAFMTACYEVLFRARMANANTYGVLALITLIGAYVLAGLGRALALQGAGIEPSINFSAPVIEFLVVNTVLAVSYYLLYAFGIAHSSAVYMSVSGMLSIPVAGAVDAAIGLSFHPLAIGGMALVFTGVLLFNVEAWCMRPLSRYAPFLVRDLIPRRRAPSPAAAAAAAAAQSPPPRAESQYLRHVELRRDIGLADTASDTQQ